MLDSVQNIYGNKVRIRVCGLCEGKEGLLMVNHTGLVEGDFWAPPGGGIELNETATDALRREFVEETGIVVDVCDFLFACEFINKPLHAIELFFRVMSKDTAIKAGYDPEMGSKKQLIQKVEYLKWDQIKEIKPNHLHGAFKYVSEPSEILDLRGYFKL